ncbi:hypothetical protein HAX54_037752, partial [Datura stramonium]|nr:hypothetical protein [Datura stramonium]
MWRFTSRVRRNIDGMPVQSVVGFRPLLGSRVASAVHGSILATHRLVFGKLLVRSIFCCASTSQRRFVDSSYDSP